MNIYKADIADVDLENGNICRNFLSHTIGENDMLANRFGVHVRRHGEDVDMNGMTCIGYFIRPDGATVAVTGSIEGSVAYVDLPQNCYAYEGQFSLAIKVTGSGASVTMRIIDGAVVNTTTDSIIDPGTIIPSIEALIAAIEAAEATIPADYSGLSENVRGMEIISVNRFNKNAPDNTAEVQLDAGSGEPSGNELCSTSGYIYIGDLDEVWTSYVVTECYYDATKTYISGKNNVNYMTEDYKGTLPSGAEYIRVSYLTVDAAAVQAGENATRAEYVPYSAKYTFRKYIYGDKVSDILGDKIHSFNRFNKSGADNVSDKYLDVLTGLLMVLEGYTTSGFIDINDLDTVKTSYVHIQCYFDSHKDFISGTAHTGWEAVDKQDAVPAGTRYIRMSFPTTYINSVQVGNGMVSRKDYFPYGEADTFGSLRISESQVLDSGAAWINRFDKGSPLNLGGKYLDITTGNILDLAEYTTSGLIDISDLDSVKESFVHLLCFYSGDGTFVSGYTDSGYAAYDSMFTVPDGAKYIRVSFPTTYLNSVQVGGKMVTRNRYYAYGTKKTIRTLAVTEDQVIRNDGIVVAPSGGDYSSLTEAVYATIESGEKITVKPGTYDIVSEYVALFGQSTVDSLADSTDLNGFQFGITLKHRKIVFEPGAHVVLDWTGHTVDGIHRFCAFAVWADVEIEGLDLDCTGTFYAIHDDYGYIFDAYHNIYKDCRIIGHSLLNNNVIGGGCKPYSKHTIQNCYIDNNAPGTVCVRYHNTNISGAEPVLFVSDSYFAQELSFRYYGDQTTKMRAYVNNCHAADITKGSEGGAGVDNVELFTWNNELTAQIIEGTRYRFRLS